MPPLDATASSLVVLGTTLPFANQCVVVMLLQAEDYGRLALYETEDVPYRRDAENFVAYYTDERKKQHARMIAKEQQDVNTKQKTVRPSV